MKNISALLTFRNSIIIFLIFYTLVTFAYVVKIPMAYLNFYAEDGLLFYQTAKDFSFPNDFLMPATGYSILVSRIIGRLITFFPVNILPQVNFIFVCIFIAFFCTVILRNLSNLISNNFLRVLSSLSLILLPIINFELMASSSSLHFLLLFPATLILINLRNGESINGADIFVLALTFLSDPISIIVLPALIKIESIKISKLLHSNNKIIYIIIFCCIALQGLYVAYSLSQGHRGISGNGSILKTIYLYLDRVVGSTLIPNFGFVSSNDFVSGLLTSKLLLRAGATIVISTIIVSMVVYLWRKSKNDVTVVRRPLQNIVLLFVVSSFYWAFSGYFFNPEPRYAIFPGLCLVAIICILFDVCASQKMIINHGFIWLKKSGVVFLLFLFISTWLFSIKPSPIRTTGTTWESELVTARNSCNNLGQENVNLHILPITGSWFVTMKCSELQ